CPDIKNTRITADNELYGDIYRYDYPSDIRYGDIYNGDILTVEDLLYALMLPSSAEAANILAYEIGGSSIQNFVKMMNDKALEIGATNTVFTNAHGLYDINQVTTANDMAKITQYALKNPVFETIATTQSYKPSIPNLENNHNENWYWTHSNIMMSKGDYFYEGARGIKTGNLEKAGRNLITMASANGSKYLVVLLKSPLYDENDDSQFYHLEDAKNLFDWAFDNIEYKTIVNATEEMGEVFVKFGSGDNDYVLVKPAKEYSSLWLNTISLTSIQKDIVLEKDVIAPVEKGQKLGTLNLKLSGESIDTIDLIAVNSVERSSTKFNIESAKQFKNSKWLKFGIITATILTLIYIIICIYAYKVSMKRKPVRGIYTKKKSAGLNIRGKKRK
ncbi:MAG TPA: D-alanyl-D-alanine carboxypeptidase, partial [Clostridiales bacterium]|nr:D-alanyl-D-alanine carboxypeptidase [Clostridiales bacterium]